MAYPSSILIRAKSLFMAERNAVTNSSILKWEDLPFDMKEEYLFLAKRQIDRDTP